MTRRRLAGVGLLLAGAALAVFAGLAALWRDAPEEPAPPVPIIERHIVAGQTPQQAAVILSSMQGHETPEPLPTTHPYYSAGAWAPLGVECNGYLGENIDGSSPPGGDEIWETAPTGCTGYSCANLGVDWSYVDDCLGAARNYAVTIGPGETISQPVSIAVPPYFIDQGGAGGKGLAGTTGDPLLTEYVPDWLESAALTTFTYDGKTYHGINYDSDVFKNWLIAMIQAAAARYGNDPQVHLVRVGVGFQAETQPVKCGAGHSSCDQASLLAAHEASVATCNQYKDFVADLVNAARAAFPNKAVSFNGGPDPCSNTKSMVYRYQSYESTATPNPGWGVLGTPVAMSLHAIAPDRADAERWNTNAPRSQGYGFLISGQTVDREFGFPVAFEYQANPAGIGASDPWQYNYWTALAGAGLGGDYLMPFYTWEGKYSNEFWDVALHKLGDGQPHAWTVLRDAEYADASYNSGTVGNSGYRGDFGNHLRLLTPSAYPQACNATVKATATASTKSEADQGHAIAYDPCPVSLPTPAITPLPTPAAGLTPDFNMSQRLLNRQARLLSPEGTMAFAVDTAWSYYGDARPVTVTLKYLDTGTDDIAVYVATTGSGAATHAIDRTGSGVWRTERWTVSDAEISNKVATSPGMAFIALAGGASSNLFAHEVSFDVGAVALDATDTPTPTPGPTATQTITPRPTATFATATATRTPTATPNWPAQACASLAPTLDGSLAEWGGVSGVTLSAASARVIQPPTPRPSATATLNAAELAAPNTPVPALSPTPTPTTTPAPGSADLSATLYCAASGDMLYFAGTITDATVQVGVTFPTTGWIGEGDSVRLTLDGARDGLSGSPLADDHELLIGPGGRLLDFDRQPVHGSAVAVADGSSWRFEVAIPKSLLALDSTGRFGLVWEVADNDGAGVEHRLADRKRMGTP